jgi:Tfp pilus assembly protein PilF
MRLIGILFAGAIATAAAGSAQSQCGPLTNSYGPFDYRTSKEQLVVVEQFHFTPDVELLRQGSTGSVGGDLDYVLRASPNHHRALMSMVNLALKTKSERPTGPGKYTVDCYFDRALRFAKDDGVVRIVYGIYLYRTGKKVEAKRVLEEARQFADDNPNLYYNLGFVYLDLGDKAKALESAHKAYRLGAQLPGLRKKLEAAGAWKDDQSAASAKDSSAVEAPLVR